ASTLDSLSPAQRRALAEDGGVPQGVSGPEVGRFRRYLQATERGAIPWDLAADSVGLQLASAASDLPAHEYKARYGEAPPQVIQGGYGPDDLRGGPSGDDLSGGPGDDHLTGGEGPDRFTFGDGD